MSALKIGDEITVINNERTKTFDQDDIQYSISQAVLSGHLILKVRRYDDGKEGMIMMSSVIVLVLKARISGLWSNEIDDEYVDIARSERPVMYCR